MTRLLVLVLLIGVARADAPSGYQCAPGSAKPGIGCACPATHVEKRDAENNATCVVKPQPVAPKCAAGMIAIPKGKFQQTGNYSKENAPTRAVTVSGFCIDK